MACRNRPIAIVLAAAAALIVAGGGSALAAPGLAAARAQAATSCTVQWVGTVFPYDWTTAKNWSTGKVPGPADDVCIGTAVAVQTGVSINVHSLTLGPQAGIALTGTTSKPLTATFATFVDLTGPVSGLDLTDATVSAAQINAPAGGSINADGKCSLNSPSITFGKGSSVQAAGGTTRLSSLAQLSNGTLTGVSFYTSGATVVLPGDITHLVASNIGLSENSAIQDGSGHNALASLTSVDAQSSLLTDSPLSLNGSLNASGDVTVGPTTMTLGGTLTQAQGTLSLWAGGPATVKASQVVIDQGALLLANQGTIAGDLVNNGSTEIFGLQVTGSYTQGPAGTLGVGLSSPLAVTGRAALAGAVDSGQPVPVPGTTGPVITFGSLTGNFTGHGLGISLLTKSQEIDAIITPQIAPSATTVAPGHQVTVNGASFGLGENVSIFFGSAAGRPLATTIGRYFGRFAAPVTIPAGATAGQHKLIAVGSNGNRAAATITVS